MFFSSEAPRHKVPAVKVNRNKALFSLTRLLLPPPPPPPSPHFTASPPRHPLHFCPEKQETRSNETLIWEGPDAHGQINTHTQTNRTPVGAFHFGSAGSAYRGVLLLVPARDEAILPLHLLHPVFIDLLEKTSQKHAHINSNSSQWETPKSPARH